MTVPPIPGPLETYQDEIYLGGLGGAVAPLPADLTGLEALARERMAATSFSYIYGGAGTGDTVRENAEAFRRWRIVPRMLTDVSAVSYRSSVLGTELAAPLLLGPVGVLRLAHPDGELAVARVAADLGVPLVLSTAASYPMEEVAAANGDGPRWYQLYWPKDRDVAASLLSRAKAAGFGVLMVTLCPGSSTQPVAASGVLALGAAATQMVCGIWLTNVTRRWPAAP